MPRPRCALVPAGERSRLASVVEAAGGEVVDVDQAEVLIWASKDGATELRATVERNPGLRWVQLPSAGIERWVTALDEDRVWTCAKGAYAEPVAEHALALALGGMRGIGRYARATTWEAPYGINLLGAEVCVLGGGEITRSLLRLLGGFGTRTTVLRRHPAPLPGAAAVLGMDQLHGALSRADLVVLALALTPETERVIDAEALATMRETAWLVNVARGRHVDTDALVRALEDRAIGGAALDVTDPEPLPDGHPLWQLDNALLTPHIGNTPEMGFTLLSERVGDNVGRWARGEPLLGAVDVRLGY